MKTAAAATVLASLHLLASSAAFAPTTGENMNGHYDISPTPNANPNKASKWTTTGDFKDYPGGVEYFDAYHGPITSTYGQVWWTHTSNDLPADIVERFHGKTMAIVGMESDQVCRTWAEQRKLEVVVQSPYPKQWH